MTIMKRLAAGIATAALTGGLMSIAAAPAEAAWFSRWIGPYSSQSSCEERRAQHGASLDPNYGFVSPECYYTNPGRGTGWYYRYFYDAS